MLTLGRLDEQAHLRIARFWRIRRLSKLWGGSVANDGPHKGEGVEMRLSKTIFAFCRYVAPSEYSAPGKYCLVTTAPHCLEEAAVRLIL